MPTYTGNYNIPKPNVNSADDEDLWGDQLNDGMDIIDTVLKENADAVLSAIPTGVVFDFAGTTAPTGFLLCYGQAISRATYAALFAVIDTTYGIGDGSTTFNLPDLRGRVVAGKDDMGGVSADRLTDQDGGVNGDVLGDTGGAETHSLTAEEGPPHTHEVPATLDTGGGTMGFQRDPVGDTATTNLNTSSSGDGDAHNNVQPTIIMNKIIKT